ncbi:MAG: DUF523 domain-containing protein [Clostridia bacterium]
MKLLVSACLLGACCRYDGKSKPNEAVCALLARHQLIPICPEQLGGLATPRAPAECRGERVVTASGMDVSAQYEKGAQEAVRIAKQFGCECAILKEHSPSCGCDAIYDGTFSGRLITGQGRTAKRLMENGVTVLGESHIERGK